MKTKKVMLRFLGAAALFFLLLPGLVSCANESETETVWSPVGGGSSQIGGGTSGGGTSLSSEATITYDVNGGIGGSVTQKVTIGKQFNAKTASEAGFTRPGYTLYGWGKSAAYTPATIGAVPCGSPVVATSSNITLYAIWWPILDATTQYNLSAVTDISSGDVFYYTPTTGSGILMLEFTSVSEGSYTGTFSSGSITNTFDITGYDATTGKVSLSRNSTERAVFFFKSGNGKYYCTDFSSFEDSFTSNASSLVGTWKNNRGNKEYVITQTGLFDSGNNKSVLAKNDGGEVTILEKNTLGSGSKYYYKNGILYNAEKIYEMTRQ